MASWGLANAKARLSEVIASAQSGEVQQITRHGKVVGLVVSPQEWARKTQPPPRPENARTTAEFFRNSPLRGSGLDLTRSKSLVRKVQL
jgi:prevent-host-death family protein